MGDHVRPESLITMGRNTHLHPDEGTIVFDVLRDNRIGGVEFVDKIEV